MNGFGASLAALAEAKREIEVVQRGPEMTFILLTLPENAKSESDVRMTPVRCFVDEIPEAVNKIKQGVLVGVLQKYTMQNLIKWIDEFDAENGFLHVATEESV